MADEWVAEVRRWYESGAAAGAGPSWADERDGYELGYEAAHPALQQTDGWAEAQREQLLDTR